MCHIRASSYFEGDDRPQGEHGRKGARAPRSFRIEELSLPLPRRAPKVSGRRVAGLATCYAWFTHSPRNSAIPSADIPRTTRLLIGLSSLAAPSYSWYFR